MNSLPRMLMSLALTPAVAIVSAQEVNVSGVVTDTGIYTPYDLESYFKKGTMGEFEMIL